MNSFCLPVHLIPSVSSTVLVHSKFSVNGCLKKLISHLNHNSLFHPHHISEKNPTAARGKKQSHF